MTTSGSSQAVLITGSVVCRVGEPSSAVRLSHNVETAWFIGSGADVARGRWVCPYSHGLSSVVCSVVGTDVTVAARV